MGDVFLFELAFVILRAMEQQDTTTLASESTATTEGVLTTTINREYMVRFLGVALLFIALTGWFIYDGKWGLRY